MKKEFVIGIDAGTGSVRAGVFDLKGRRAGYGACPIKMWRDGDLAEQSSDDIWSAACKAVKSAMTEAGARGDSVIGLAFDATCSLVALDGNDRPLTVSPSGKSERNVVVWMDHRAKKETEAINATHHAVLKYVGGKMSPEQEPPKLMWIKKHVPATWRAATRFMDLADFLTYRATGEDVRSMCTVVCKWGYLGHKGRYGSWDPGFYSKIGLGDLMEGSKIGRTIRPMGTPVGRLTPKAAKELGLSTEAMVGVGIIDAHAGGIGLMGIPTAKDPSIKPSQVLSLIGGTSTCHMALSKKPIFVPGVWGPYYGAMAPGMWLTEGGQSATGSLVDHIVQSSAHYLELQSQARNAGATVFGILNRRVEALRAKDPLLTRDLHMLPYFHGNRSPRANPDAKGCISGLTLDGSIDGLAKLYLATLEALAYGTRHIIESMNSAGHGIRVMASCGGLSKNELFLKAHADATGCDIYLPEEEEAVLAGSAILGAMAAGRFKTISEAAGRMTSASRIVRLDRKAARFHDRRYEVFKAMYRHQIEYLNI